ncbi:hypothetical protein ACROYT_G028933 [Oculina patagonica]
MEVPVLSAVDSVTNGQKANFTTIQSKKPKIPSKQADTSAPSDSPSSDESSSDESNVSLCSCPEEGCIKRYQRFSSLQQHLDCGKHHRAIENESLLGKAITGYSEILELQSGSTLLNNSPLNTERFVGVLECPNVFRQFSLVPLAFVSKRCCVVSVAVFEITSEAYVRILLLDNINKEIIKVTKVNQWRSTSNVIDWFKAIPSKSQHAFITFDVCDFYPSISEQLLTKALDYASKFTHITPQDSHIITHAKKSLLYHQNTPWEKRNSNNLFDVTMGSYDGAETCELVGLYMLSLITPKFKGQVGLYRDDGLAVCKATPKQIEKIKQEVCDIFKSNGLKITIEANKKTINFLDVTLDLTSGSYKPFMKPNNKILYVHRHSNHPPALLKNIPENINKRLTSISSNQKVFDEAIPPYQKALDESGYNHKLTFNPQPKRNRNRQRKIVWYNPPWDANVKTNLGRKFLNIIDRCFPSGHPLHKIFNKHTLKLSYSCMPNMKSIISSHNKAVLSGFHQSQTTQTCNKECNCRKKDQCPLDGKCLSQNVVYQATVTTQTSSESYVGLASNFKDRYRNHTASFRHESKRNETELSKHVWTLQDTNKPFSIKWRIIKQCRPYNNINNKCNLCLFEKFVIICKKNLCSLNKRNELASSCPHRNRFLLKNFVIK